MVYVHVPLENADEITKMTNTDQNHNSYRKQKSGFEQTRTHGYIREGITY
jgi:hypothetical protein